MNYIKYIITICMMIFSAPLIAQIENIEFQRFTTSDGLSSNWNLNTIVQDNNGYIWIATSDGLNRFDGYNFKVYRYNPDDSTSLKSNKISSLLIDQKNRLWISTVGTDKGSIALWNQKDDNFINYSTEKDDSLFIFPWIINTLSKSKSGNFWVGSLKGLDLFNSETRKYTHYRDNHSGIAPLANENIIKILEDSKGNIWIGTLENGLTKYNPKDNSLQRYLTKENKSVGLASNSVGSIYEDSDGSIYIGTAENKLHVYDPISDSVIRLQDNSGKFKNLSPPIGITGSLFGRDRSVSIINRTANGNFWLSTSNGGLKVYNNDFTKFSLFKNDPANKLSLSEDYILSMFEDNHNNIWLGTISRGLMKIIPSRSLFKPEGNNLELLNTIKSKHIRSIFESTDGNIYIGTLEGFLYIYTPSKRRIEEFKYGLEKNNAKNVLSGVDIDDIYEDKNGIIYLATFGGIDKYNPKTGIFSKMQIKVEGKIISNFGDCEAILQDKDGGFWIATWDNGIFYYNINSQNFKRYHGYYSGPKYLSHFNIFTLFRNSKGSILIGTADGLNIFDESSNTFNKYLLGNSIHSIQEDKEGIIWATSNKGLIKFNLNTKFSKRYSLENGFPSDLIGGILIDNDGFIWLGTSKGLVRFDPANETYLLYDDTDGAQSDLFEAANSYFKTKNGLLFFGSSTALTVFNPINIDHNNHPPKVIITALNIFDNENGTSTAKRNSLSESASSITLKHSENELVFEYVGIHFTKSERNKYKYRLEPYDQNWLTAGTQRAARYTNLDPGKYEFKVISANSDGVWTDLPASINITILPPWWQTWWAYSLYVITAFGFLFFVRKFELERKLKNSKIKESQLRAEAAELQAKAAEAQSKIIQAENERKSIELEEARQLQLSLLPKKLPAIPHLDIAVYMKTATEVGGDYYDFSTKDDGSLNICLGDATGHGMKAGTLVSMIKSLFTANSIDKSIEEFFNSSNKALKNSKLDKMMMAFAMVNINNNSVHISNAGIPPVYIYRSDSNIVEEIKLNGLPLGAMKNSTYDIYESKLAKGDTLLMLSDGMPELQNRESIMYGYDRLKDTFKKCAHETAENILDTLKNEGAYWLNDKEPDDDITFVIVKFI